MKKLILVPFLFIALSCFSQERIAYSDTTKYYQFSVNYWFNMHHFLWVEAFMNQEVDSTMIDMELDADAKSELKAAVDYYRNKLVAEDLRMSDYQTAFKNWITNKEATLDEIPNQFNTHMKVLKKFSPTYNHAFWNDHLRACKRVLQENIPLIRATEESYVDQITKLTRQFWDFDPIKVDVTIYAKSSDWNLRNRPYTSIFPTHVVMNAAGENDVQGNWTELLYHESAHHLILSSNYFIGGTIRDLVEVKGYKTPRQLWHAILFYFTGEISRDLFEAEGLSYPETYMQRNNVFSGFHTLLEKHFSPYMDRKIILAEAVDGFIQEASKEN
ncbi:hypothetical protein [Ekhidna sp.]|uniref:hypothetical protein n=1 Tax=Ekhidna sp. TaxID=2608089 RepID=UPI003C7A9C58